MGLHLPTDARAFLGQNAISYSEISTLAACEWKWKALYDGPKHENTSSPAMDLGREMHRLLGLWWDPKDAALDVFVTENPTAEWLIRRYDEYYMEDAAPLRMLDLEIPFAVKLPWGPYLFGYFDGLVYNHETGQHWITEFKTMGNWSKLNQLPVDKQITLYQYAATASGLPTVGVMYDAIRTYMWTGKNADQHDPAESFERLFITRTEEQIQECLDELESAYSVQLDLRYNLRKPIRNVGTHCDWCACMPECYGIGLTLEPEHGTLAF